MTPEKVREVLAIYRKMFEEWGLEKISYPHDETLTDDEIGLAHCHGMLDQMEAFIDEGRMDKVYRWLGFIQGVLWATGHRNLDSMKDENRSTKAD